MASIVGRNIRGIRTDLGYSQAKLAGLARTSQPCIRRIETGNETPALGCMASIARALRVAAAGLLRETSHGGRLK